MLRPSKLIKVLPAAAVVKLFVPIKNREPDKCLDDGSTLPASVDTGVLASPRTGKAETYVVVPVVWRIVVAIR